MPFSFNSSSSRWVRMDSDEASLGRMPSLTPARNSALQLPVSERLRVPSSTFPWAWGSRPTFMSVKESFSRSAYSCVEISSSPRSSTHWSSMLQRTLQICCCSSAASRSCCCASCSALSSSCEGICREPARKRTSTSLFSRTVFASSMASRKGERRDAIWLWISSSFAMPSSP